MRKGNNFDFIVHHDYLPCLYKLRMAFDQDYDQFTILHSTRIGISYYIEVLKTLSDERHFVSYIWSYLDTWYISQFALRLLRKNDLAATVKDCYIV